MFPSSCEGNLWKIRQKTKKVSFSQVVGAGKLAVDGAVGSITVEEVVKVTKQS